MNKKQNMNRDTKAESRMIQYVARETCTGPLETWVEKRSEIKEEKKSRKEKREEREKERYLLYRGKHT